MPKQHNKNLSICQQVISADFVFGPCDLIVPVRAQNNIDLEKVVRKIDAEVSGIEEAQTTVVAMMQI